MVRFMFNFLLLGLTLPSEPGYLRTSSTGADPIAIFNRQRLNDQTTQVDQPLPPKNCQLLLQWSLGGQGQMCSRKEHYLMVERAYSFGACVSCTRDQTRSRSRHPLLLRHFSNGTAWRPCWRTSAGKMVAFWAGDNLEVRPCGPESPHGSPRKLDFGSC